MCTAISFHSKDHYFGRNLDLEYHYMESVAVIPRNFPFPFRHAAEAANHHAIIGIGMIADGYPLLYDAVNEHGLAIAALNFPNNAHYKTWKAGYQNITSFELIPWILCNAKKVSEAKKLLRNINLVNDAFSDSYPSTPLHWLMADKYQCVTIEPLFNGLQVMDNPIGVLTNNPPFDCQLNLISHYANLTNIQPQGPFAKLPSIESYSRGLGCVGLPGDLSSMSRFVRAAFTASFARTYDEEQRNVNQFFHLLDSVYQVEGCNNVKSGQVKTIYSSCCNTDYGIYYFTTYGCRQIRAVNMSHEDLNQDCLISYRIYDPDSITCIN